MNPIYKFNNGRGAMLCNGCRVIISTGPKTEELLCNDCKEKCESETCTACKIYAAEKGSSHCSSCRPLIKNLIKQMMKADEELGLYDATSDAVIDAVIDVVNRQGEISEGAKPIIITK